MRRTSILWAGLVCALVSTVALAQGFFYKEVVKDGRIYVFNLGPEYERWEQTGETGRAITRLNYGPAGETVVFDSEEAIDLYNFKHGIAEVVMKPKPPRCRSRCWPGWSAASCFSLSASPASPPTCGFTTRCNHLACACLMGSTRPQTKTAAD